MSQLRRECWFGAHELSKSLGKLLGYMKIICKMRTTALNAASPPPPTVPETQHALPLSMEKPPGWYAQIVGVDF